jgi:hypothetical protein
MFLRRINRKKSGKNHFYWALVFGQTLFKLLAGGLKQLSDRQAGLATRFSTGLPYGIKKM